MKKLVLFTALLVSLLSCVSTRYYGFALVTVDRPVHFAEKHGAIAGEKNIDLKSPYCTFHDSCLRISIAITDDRIAFKLTNTMQKSFNVVWDKCGFKSPTGSIVHVIHQGTNYAHKEEWQRPSVVASGNTIDDFLLPAFHVSVYAEGNDGFAVKPLIFSWDFGKECAAVFALEIDNEIVEYTIRFTINPVQK